jgi:hypothetical protein
MRHYDLKQVNLGKRPTDQLWQQPAMNSKRQKLAQNHDLITLSELSETKRLSSSDHKMILQEANRRLLYHNLQNLLQSLQKTKDSYPEQSLA